MEGNLLTIGGVALGVAAGKTGHNSPAYDEWKTQSERVLALPRKQAHQDNSNLCEFHVRFPLLIETG